jgi:hypothetical protein
VRRTDVRPFAGTFELGQIPILEEHSSLVRRNRNDAGYDPYLSFVRRANSATSSTYAHLEAQQFRETRPFRRGAPATRTD